MYTLLFNIFLRVCNGRDVYLLSNYLCIYCFSLSTDVHISYFIIRFFIKSLPAEIIGVRGYGRHKVS